VCRSSLYALIKKGEFPKPVKITGARAVAWSSQAVDAWVAARIAGVNKG
jgi:prophage regulatory protein